MKKIVFMGIAILLVIGLVAGGTFAYFSDVETSEGNVIKAGTIDLAVNDENPWVSEAFTFEDIKPCEELSSFFIKFENVGQNPGILFTEMIVFENDKAVDTDTTFEFYAGPGATPGTPATRPEWEMTAEEFARLIYVEAVQYQYTCSAEGYTGSWNDDLTEWLLMDEYFGNVDGKLSLWEICQAGQIPYATDPLLDPTFPATATIEWEITFHLAHAFYTGPDDEGGAYTGAMADYLTGGGDYWLYTIPPVMWNVPQADGISLTVNGYLYQVGHAPPGP